MKIPKHIFIVHNREINSVILDYILSKDRIYRFLSFNSVEECLESLYLNPDVIILDYELPGMNGYDTVLKIKKQIPSVRLITLINRQDGKLTNELLKAGVNDCVLKEGNGEMQIIEKVDALLTKDELDVSHESKKKTIFEKLFYSLFSVLIIIIEAFYVNGML